MTGKRDKRMRAPRKPGEALTRDEALALEELLGRPITWPPQHHHSGEGVLRQKDDPEGANRVYPKGGEA